MEKQTAGQEPPLGGIKAGIKNNCPEAILKPTLSAYRLLRNACHDLKLSVVHHGGSLECYCCGKKSKHFLRLADLGLHYGPFKANQGATIAAEAICPHCLSLPRHRVACYWLAEKWGRVNDAKVLSIAPENCLRVFFARKNIPVQTADLFAPDVDMRFDLQDIPLENDSWDIVLCNHVLEHVENDLKAMAEIARILKPSGVALITVPTDLNSPHTIQCTPDMDAEARERLCGQFDHLRLYGRDITSRLANCFKYEVFDGSAIDSASMQAFGPRSMDVNRVYICGKL